MTIKLRVASVSCQKVNKIQRHWNFLRPGLKIKDKNTKFGPISLCFMLCKGEKNRVKTDCITDMRVILIRLLKKYTKQT